MTTWERAEYLALLSESAQAACQPADLLAVLAFESGLNPRAYNAAGHAKGLNQMTPTPLLNLGWKKGNPDYDAAEGEYLNVPVCHQLAWARRYFNDWRLRMKVPSWEDAGSMYLCNFWPAGIQYRKDMLHVLVDPKEHPLAYNSNKVLDHGKKGYINVGDMSAAMARARLMKPYLTAKAALDALQA